MKSKIFWLILTISIWWPVTGQSQLHLDYFDEDVLRLARLVWDDSIDQKTEEWLHEIICGEYHSNYLWASLVIGVHLEEIEMQTLKTATPPTGFQSILLKSLQSAKKSYDIDSFFFHSIDTSDLSVVRKRTHSMVTHSDFLMHMQSIRYVKKMRRQEQNEEDIKRIHLLQHFQPNEIQFEIASCSSADLISILHSYNDPPPYKFRGLIFPWHFQNYRGIFLDELKKYHPVEVFDNLTDTLQHTLIRYWMFNLDLMEESERIAIYNLMSQYYPEKKLTGFSLHRIMLRNLIAGIPKEKHIEEIFNMSDTAAHNKMMKEIGERMRLENSQRLQPPIEKIEEVTQQETGVRRPESFVTTFRDKPAAEILDYIELNLSPSLYSTPHFILKNPETVKMRAAIDMIGNLYHGNPYRWVDTTRINPITKTLVDISLLEVEECYEEASFLIHRLGGVAIPILKKEFFSKDSHRAQFAAQKLYELKNREIVNWLIEVLKTHQDRTVQKRGRLLLTIMRNHKSLQMPDRGITKEESKRITHELIDPYLEKN